MRDEKSFSLFGRDFKVKQHSAQEAISVLMLDAPRPEQWLAHTSILSDSGEWVRLSGRAEINAHVQDAIRKIKPYMVLKTLIGIVQDFNVGFLKNWKPIRIPHRFLSGVPVDNLKSAGHTASVVSNLITARLATLKELEEYYSLEDAYKMADVETASSINKMLSQEAAQKEK